MEVEVKKLTKESSISSQFLKKLASYVLLKEKAPKNAEVSLALVEKEEIKKLNRKYRGENALTDVLSFPLKEEENKDEPFLLGEVIISPEVVRKQAQKYGNSFKKELSLLVVHGLLHLLGYNHQNSLESKVMRIREKTLLDKIFKENRGANGN